MRRNHIARTAIDQGDPGQHAVRHDSRTGRGNAISRSNEGHSCAVSETFAAVINGRARQGLPQVNGFGDGAALNAQVNRQATGSPRNRDRARRIGRRDDIVAGNRL